MLFKCKFQINLIKISDEIQIKRLINLINQDYIMRYDDSRSIFTIKNFNAFSQKIILNEKFELKVDNSQLKFEPSYFIKFFQIKAFNSEKSVFENLHLKHNKIQLEFYYSTLAYSGNCTGYDTDGIFQYVDLIAFTFNVKYTRNICPILFQNSALDALEFHGIITKRMILVKNATHLKINGLLDKIKNDSFQFATIKGISFNIDNGINDLNDVKQNQDNVVLIHSNSKFTTNSYDFPDHDFCAFKNFPDHRNTLNYSCLTIWLLKKACPFYNLLNINKQMMICRNMTTFKDQVKACNFAHMTRMCSLSTFEVKQVSKSLILYFAEVSDYYFVIIQYVLVLGAFLSNSYAFFVLQKIKSNLTSLKSSKNSIEYYMLANCCINLMYLVTRLIHLVSKCVYPYTMFCSEFHFTYESQLIEILVVDIMGNLLKFSSSLLQIFVSINRLIPLSSQIRIKINSISISKAARACTLLFFCINIGILIASQLMMSKINIWYFARDHLENYKEYPDKKFFFMNYLSPVQPIRLQLPSNKSVTILIMFILNIFINNILTTIIFCMAEILVLFNAQSNMRRKKNLSVNNDKKNLKKILKLNKPLNVIIFAPLFKN
ncbi:hypothetical protein BpHYR1_018175 [Brachionus plicatilis]|uniref:Uncharacterized protein n=1 Tax=Brachionus plicatilis TaxID=10195 RepID=A0A3M7SHS7_BRAPC|nr:hypothetical protein BpHYR1_018175 [Brachionus plicatilis]